MTGEPLMLVDMLGVAEGRTGLVGTLSTRAATEKPAAGRSLPQHVVGHHGYKWIYVSLVETSNGGLQGADVAAIHEVHSVTLDPLRQGAPGAFSVRAGVVTISP